MQQKGVHARLHATKGRSRPSSCNKRAFTPVFMQIVRTESARDQTDRTDQNRCGDDHDHDKREVVLADEPQHVTSLR
jgi:hypothetical protein